jgi:hypothetical protein
MAEHRGRAGLDGAVRVEAGGAATASLGAGLELQ